MELNRRRRTTSGLRLVKNGMCVFTLLVFGVALNTMPQSRARELEEEAARFTMGYESLKQSCNEKVRVCRAPGRYAVLTRS